MNIIFILIAVLLPALAGAETVRHEIKLKLNPAESLLEIRDTITLPEYRKTAVFSLHKGLNPASPTKGVSIERLDPETRRDAYEADYSTAADIFENYSAVLPQGVKAFALEYRGAINHPLAEQGENYARAFSETPGLITGDGVYLSGASYWYPQFSSTTVSYKLETDLPEGWDSVSGGSRAGHITAGGRTITVWRVAVPQDEITLAAGKYKEYSAGERGLELYVFLREANDELARKYLDAASRYVKMYSELIGPYPYAKFALVENFWETGYGIPSFTLLGPKVIRLPFILNSSYPHEILHNWWGNGVFVDYDKGNWCEGLTAYLADYLISEGRGKGKEYRMTTLQKYADYAAKEKDFPLSQFRSRHSSASEAVGYGKALMFWHMLRLALGDHKFRLGLHDFYVNNRFRAASFDDLRASFEKQTGAARLDKFFDQWVNRTGAPELEIRNVKVSREMDEYAVEFSVVQKQEGPAYYLEVLVAVLLEEGGQARLTRAVIQKKEEIFKYYSKTRPVRLEFDPEFDIFRQLDPRETQPSLSRLLGADKPLVILPAAASGETYAAYEAFASAWTKDKSNLPEIVKDSDLPALPAGRPVWALGRENIFFGTIAASLETLGAKLGDKAFINNREFPFSSDTFVFAGYSPADGVSPAGLILAASPAALPALAAKLPHYGKYGYLVFDAGMTAIKTGAWETKSSPLFFDLTHGVIPPAKYYYPRRDPLAAPDPLFSKARMKEHVLYLASELKGRGPGEPGLKKAGDYIGKRFRQYGLKPFFNGKAEQTWSENGLSYRNLAGFIEGASRKDEFVFITAHYDHLAAEGGKVFPGANDNASGVALLLELAEYYSRHRPARKIVFAAFDGEESGRVGSRYFVNNLAPGLSAKTNADINLDSIGRRDGGKLLFLNSGSSGKWQHILRGAGFVTGMEYEASAQDLDSSDQASFIEAGVPAVQALSGISPDHHKVSDTADKIDYAGMAAAGEFLKEMIDYLAGDSDFITRPGTPASQPARPAPAPGTRKAFLGLVPSFEWQGKGAQANSITPGSPLSKTDFRPGDVLIKMNDAAIGDLRDCARELTKYKPGDRIKITWLSGNAEKTAEVELTAR